MASELPKTRLISHSSHENFHVYNLNLETLKLSNANFMSLKFQSFVNNKFNASTINTYAYKKSVIKMPHIFFSMSKTPSISHQLRG